MQECVKCHKMFPIDRFAKNGEYYRHQCKDCDCQRVKDGIKQTREYLTSLKTKCNRCGYDKCKSALEWHHKDGEDKDFTISRLASQRIWSLKTKELIDKEIAKCELLCSNCHREEHDN